MKRRLPIDPDHWRYWLLANILFLLFVIVQSSKNIGADAALPPEGLLFVRIVLVISWVLFLLCRPYYGSDESIDHDTYLEYLHEEKRSQRRAKKRERKLREAEKNSLRTQQKAAQAKQYADLRRKGYADPTYKGPKCPSCGSIEFQVIGRDHKPISISGAIVGHMIAGDPGMIIGAAMGKDGKYEAICLKCGKRFKFK